MNDIVLSIIAATLLILLLVAGIIITFFIANRQRVRQAQELTETKLAYERELRQVEHEVREHIMGEFARELHDNIGQLLTAMHFDIENRKMDFPDRKEDFKPIEIYVNEIRQQLKLLSKTYNSDFITHSGLVTSIASEVERLIALRKFRVTYSHDEKELSLDSNQELMVFRIVQEILQNALKYSNAKNLTIHLESNPFELKIEDDGIGFDFTETKARKNGSGLDNIFKRSQMARLDCIVRTKLHEGTSYILKKSSH